jgi:small subunit ribosomal protein S17
MKIATRGRTFKGEVVSSKAQKTVTVAWDRRVFVPKYERYYTKRSKVKAHNPPEIAAKEGDTVIIQECRPLSKTKKFIVTEILK